VWRDYQEIVAITLHQPWAALVALQGPKGKRYETRSWAPPRGMLKPGDYLAIHASLQSWPETARELGPAEAARLKMNCLRAGVHTDVHLIYGCVVAVTRYLGAVRTDSMKPSEREAMFGDWSFGRWAWELELVESIEPPVLATGHQKLWWWATGSHDGPRRKGQLAL